MKYKIILDTKQIKKLMYQLKSCSDKWYSNDWEIARSMIVHENEFGSFIVDNKLYLVGGRNDFGRFTPDLTVYDSSTRFFKQLSRMNHARR